MAQTPQVVYSSLNDDELYSEIQVLRQEIAAIVSDIRILIGNIRKTPEDWYPAEIADTLEEIVNG